MVALESYLELVTNVAEVLRVPRTPWQYGFSVHELSSRPRDNGISLLTPLYPIGESDVENCLSSQA